jgi:hypothetical protein
MNHSGGAIIGLREAGEVIGADSGYNIVEIPVLATSE